MNDSFGDRMKAYEDVNRVKLTPRTPTIIRVDGCHFHTFTRGFDKPFDDKIHQAMTSAGQALLHDISGAKLVYIQSDEISVLVNDYDKFATQSWFDKNLQKMVSVAASIATAYFNRQINHTKLATFDGRAFVLPIEEVCNYFVWRQKDAIRNSISGLAQSFFSPKKLQNKSTKDMKLMLEEENVIWDSLEPWQKYGWCITRQQPSVLLSSPLFSENREFVNDFLSRTDE